MTIIIAHRSTYFASASASVHTGATRFSTATTARAISTARRKQHIIYLQQQQQLSSSILSFVPSSARGFSSTLRRNNLAWSSPFSSPSSSSPFSTSAGSGSGSSDNSGGNGSSSGGSGGANSNGGVADGISSSSSPLNAFASLTSQLDEIAPRFEIDADAVHIIRGPVEFYDLLKTKILNAKRRIYLSTLYFGPAEHDLVITIAKALRQNPQLKISILTDALRGTRETPGPTCASLLAPLVQEFGTERVQIRMFHTPNLTGLRKRMIPRRFNEGWGLQHMKLYGIDDEMVMSGANLSREYFTNRQDRYHLLCSKELTEYYEKIHDAISSISYAVSPPRGPKDEPAGYSIDWPHSNQGPSPVDDPKGYVEHATSLVGPLIGPKRSRPAPSKANTIVYPVFQLEQLLPTENPNPKQPLSFESTEIRAVTTVLLALGHAPFQPTTLTFTAGYFNPSQSLVSLILSTKPASVTALAASPYANGFFGSRGVSGMLPDAYTLLGRRFLEQAQKHNLYANGRVRLLEWRRGWGKETPPPGQLADDDAEKGWTYHAKGMWITLPPPPPPPPSSSPQSSSSLYEQVGPAITLVGSSNYTARSAKLDLEANALIITQDARLQRKLAEEEAWLKEHAKRMDMDDYTRTERRVSWRVRVAMRIVEAVGGAL